ncbi:MAG: PLP-dependent aminotransferase family protein [Azospirillaceae bacterium]
MAGELGSARRHAATALSALTIDRRARPGIAGQLAEGIRALIRDGRLAAGARLPASRDLAAEHGIGRSTVVAVYEQLVAEGLLAARVGRGTQVSPEAPRLLAAAPRAEAGPARVSDPAIRARPFAITGMADDLLPGSDWVRAVRQSAPAALVHLGRDRGFGLPALRQAIAEHVASLKGLSVAADQIVVTSGHAESVLLIARAAFAPGSAVYVEDPGYAVTWRTLALAEVRPVLRTVDADGLAAPAAAGDGDTVAGAILTPSRQFPLGTVMPIGRRLAWTEWARRMPCRWLVEDDFDSELRYRGGAPTALAALLPDQVIYEASFSKLIGRGLRLGFLVVPPRLRDVVAAIQPTIGFGASLAAQAPLARFLESGAWPRHLRRLRRVLRHRFEIALRRLAILEVAGLVAVGQQDGGMHVALTLTDARLVRRGDRAVAAALRRVDVEAQALSTYCAGPNPVQGLVLGFAGWPEARLEEAFDRFGETLRTLATRRTVGAADSATRRS